MNYVFFDMDGTLHKQDVFFDFIKYSITKRLINIVLFFPFIVFFTILYLINPKGKYALNGVLFFLFFGVKECELDKMIDSFCNKFLTYHTPFEYVKTILDNHVENGNKIILISGTPLEFIKIIYPDYFNSENIIVIASITKYSFFSFFLDERCVFKNKKNMLFEAFNEKILFSNGYSDSLADLPILELCENAYIVDKNGNLAPYK